jgi:hypothetical protein
LLGWQGELEGVALSGRDGQLVWVNLRLPDVAAEKAGAEGNGGGDGLGERERQDVEMVGLVLDLLQDPSVHKATYDLKMQVRGAGALCCTLLRAAQVCCSSAGCTDMSQTGNDKCQSLLVTN